MSDMQGREKHVTDNSKGVHKRGEGLGTGPVGRADGYAGRNDSTPTPGPSSGGPKRSGGGGKLGMIIVIIILLLGGGGGATSLLTGGGSDTSSYTAPAPTQTATTPAPAAVADPLSGVSTASYSDLLGMFGGFSGGGVSSGWTEGRNNTGKLDNSVAEGARAKRTKILGDNEDKITIMVYMCGTDLESRSGMATNDLREMMNASLSDNINILIYTGGCNGWKTSGISNRTCQIYTIKNGRLECLEDDMGDNLMTEPATLASFIKYCKKHYPANRNDLIFWDHGGGSITGYGYDEKHQGSGSMDLAEINQALKEGGATFDFIGFDACLMATLETALMCDDYADYLIASEETEPGIGWYYTDWLNALSKDTSMPTVQIGKNIVDSFVDECNRRCGGQKTTLSVTDLAELSATVPEKLKSFSSETSELIKNNEYKTVSNARVGSREFATSSKIDQIDLVNFADNIGTTEAKAFADTLLSCVKYNRTSSSMTNAYGLSIYFPYKKANRVNSMATTYNAIGVNSEYTDCIKAFAGMEVSGQISAGGQGSAMTSILGMAGGDATGGDALTSLLTTFLTSGREIPGVDEDAASLLDSSSYDGEAAADYINANRFDPSYLKWTSEDDLHVLDMPESEWEYIQNLQMNMFVDDGDGYVDLGLDNIYNFTEDGKLIGDCDKTWLAIDGQPVAYYYESQTGEGDEKVITGRVPVLLDGERANLIIVFDSEHPYGYIAGARYDYVLGETDAIAKGVTEIEEGTVIDFLCDHYTYDGKYEDSYYLGAPMEYYDGAEISNVDVTAGDESVELKVTYLLTDIYNVEYWTPAVPD